MAATKKTPKAPQDHQPKAEPKARPEDTPGWNLMKPMSDIPVWDQIPLIQQLSVLQDESDEASLKDKERAKKAAGDSWDEEAYDEAEHATSMRSFDLSLIGDMIKKLRECAVDADAFTKFVSGAGAMDRAMNLAFAWVGQMGESLSSED